VIAYLIYHWKILPVAITLWVAAALLAVESSLTPWIFGALVPIGIFILGVLGAILKAAWTIQGRMSTMEAQVSPLWSAFQQTVAKSLHNPEIRDKEADDLIDDLEHRMTPAKMERLRVLMTARAADPSRGEQERKRAELLLFIMSQIKEENIKKAVTPAMKNGNTIK